MDANKVLQYLLSALDHAVHATQQTRARVYAAIDRFVSLYLSAARMA